MKSFSTAVLASALCASTLAIAATAPASRGASGMHATMPSTMTSSTTTTPSAKSGSTTTSPSTTTTTTRGPSTTGQPNQNCETLGNQPGSSMTAPGSAFNPNGTAGGVYAGNQPQSSGNTASVSQYDVACARSGSGK